MEPGLDASEHGRTLKRARREGVTLAYRMRRDRISMRDASIIMFGLERAGLVSRTGGGRGEAFVWRNDK